MGLDRRTARTTTPARNQNILVDNPDPEFQKFPWRLREILMEIGLRNISGWHWPNITFESTLRLTKHLLHDFAGRKLERKAWW